MKVETNGNELTIGNKSVMLNLRQMTIFKRLRIVSPAVVSQGDLLKATGIEVMHTLRQHVSTLKIKLKAFDGVEIVTHSKVGYQLKINGEMK